MIQVAPAQLSRMVSVALRALSELAAHLAVMACLEIADHHREFPVATEFGDDLLIQPLLAVFNSQGQVGALLGGELKNADEVCSASAGIRTPQVPACSAEISGLRNHTIHRCLGCFGQIQSQIQSGAESLMMPFSEMLEFPALRQPLRMPRILG